MNETLIKGTRIKDSGTREKMETGSQRDSRAGKGRYDLLPWFGLDELAKHMEQGCLKYGDRNWERGQPLARYLDSAIRHCKSVMVGQHDEDHLRAAAWNIMCALDTRQRIRLNILPASLDDLPRYDFSERLAVVVGPATGRFSPEEGLQACQDAVAPGGGEITLEGRASWADPAANGKQDDEA